MKNLKEFKGQKYIIMMLLSIVLCCITVYANDKAIEDATLSSGSQQEEVIEQEQQEDELTKLLEEITALKEEVAEMKDELNNVKQLNSKTYIAQKDVNVFAETSSYSELMGTFKSGSVIKINTISEDSIWAETDQGYVKLMFLTQLAEAQQEALFVKAEPKKEEVKPQVAKASLQTTEYRIGVTGKSGLSKEDLDYLLAGSRMTDCSDEVLQVEANHNVNAFFTISVAQAETQRGTTGTGKSKNNAFGITDPKRGGYRYFNTLGGSVLEFGGMMERVYISKGRDTISKVHAIYTDSPNWSGNVNTIMNKELAKIKAK